MQTDGARGEPAAPLDSTYRSLFSVAGLPTLILATLASRIATQMSSVLIVLYVLETRHSSQLSGLVILCSQFPGILVSPIAGALLDRGRKIPLMIVDYVVGAAAVSAIAALALAHALPDLALLLIVSVASLTQPLSRVGGRALFPVMVPRHLWDRSNAVDSGCFVVATVLGPAVAGVAVAVIGARAALVLPAVLLFVGALGLARVPAPPFHPLPHEQGLLADAGAAIRYVFSNRVLRMLAGTMTVFNFAGGSLTVAIPVVVLRVLHGGSKAVGVMFAVMGAAGFLAGLVTGRVGTEGREKSMLAGSCMATAAALVVLALGFHHVAVVVLCIAVVGVSNGPLTVAMFSLRQRATEPQWFGRAFAVSMNLNFAGNPIGSAIAGLLLAHSILVAFLAAAACALVGGIWPAVLPVGHYTPLVVTDGRSAGVGLLGE
ncbi:MAG TPA: MFS transporter [Acidimicrobiales bacterium]|nr:MFS transporter [Acidimicrobiales bacterium]